MNSIIERYKKIRKKGMLENKYKGKYAFVGIGNHSINNLYPVLNYLNVDIKYIVVRSKETLGLIENNFPNIIATTNLDEVLDDDEVRGVFVSAHPMAHFSIAKQVLKANKNVFIEKPPCTSLIELTELIDIETASKGNVLVGLQRRYSPVYNILLDSSIRKNASYYTLKYKIGAYAEGDELLDVFIHPLDAMFYLFGVGEIENVKVIDRTSTIVYLVQIQHENGTVGSIELSTDYSWVGAQDILVVNTPKGEYITDNTSKLIFQTKPKVFMNIPLEKLKGFTSQSTVLYEQNNFLPIKEHNQLYSSGYFSEMEAFLNICEKGTNLNKSKLEFLQSTFEAMEKLRKLKSN